MFESVSIVSIVIVALAFFFFSKQQRKQMSENITNTIVHTTQLADQTAKSALASSTISNLADLQKELTEANMTKADLDSAQAIQTAIISGDFSKVKTIKEEEK